MKIDALRTHLSQFSYEFLDRVLDCFFFFNDTATTEIYTREDTLSLHDALPISTSPPPTGRRLCPRAGRTRWRSEEHTSELQSPFLISYAVFCLKKKNTTILKLIVDMESLRKILGSSLWFS